MEKSSESGPTAPSAPLEYDEEFKPPACNPPPYSTMPMPMQSVPLQQAAPHSQPLYPQQIPYPQQQYAPQAVSAVNVVGQQPTSIVQTERVVIGNVPVGPRPLTANCPFCQKMVKTTIETKVHGSAHLLCVLLCCLGWCCCCCLLPYCMSSFRSVHHTCPNCKAFLGTYHKA